MLESFTKRGLSLLLVLIMVLSMVPVSALATQDSADADAGSEILQIDTEPTEAEQTEAEPEEMAAAEPTYPNTEDDGHEHVAIESERVPALCEDDGMTSGTYCQLCGVTLSGREVIPALGHNVEQYDAKLPTFSKVGWEAYEDCTRCGYSTYVEIPMLEKPVIEDYETFILALFYLEELANAYALEHPGTDPLNLMIKYIRTGVDRYNSGSWGIMAGYEDAGFAKYVADIEDMLNSEVGSIEEMFCITSLKNINNFYLPNGELTDIGHMFGTMDITYHNNFGVNHADVGGWAGDLVDLLEFSDYSGISGSLEEMVAQINEETFLVTAPENVGGFNTLDLIGDLDAMYLMNQLKKEGYHYEYEVSGLAINLMMYFTEDLSMVDRAEYFLKNRMDGITTRNDLREAVYNAYTTNKVITTLEGTREFQSADLDTLRRAVCYTYADFICKLAGDYVEDAGNDLFTVFSTEKATLAPGITQQIKMATNAEGKQIVYYLATGDLTRDDIHIYANYHNNDPSQGWEMQRVLDQANAAQERHSDPNSEHYIENYNVIAAINGAGFNMSTGQPSGLLVMEGITYSPVNGDGFFGILKDGTPVIASTAEYNSIYKDQVQEGIACFGSRLIKDGKIIEGLSDDDASRTAVGITKTGKVVFLVLDGRQDPFSVGGGYATLAQILLEAGCVEATNLDGGGSTTFVAKQPGDDALSVVNRPSDGYARSVSTSLIMVSTAPSSTAFDHAVIESDYSYLSAGASQQMTAVGISPSGNTVEIPEGSSWAVSDETMGSITADGMFTALKNGDVDVCLMRDGNVIGSTTLHIVSPDNVYFTKSNLDTVYGETKELPVKVLYQGKQMAFVPSDIKFTLSNKQTGTVSGLNFVATSNENVSVTGVTVTASLVANPAAQATIKIALYKQGELSFDFEQATGGDRQLAWQREVSNSVSDDDTVYISVDPGQDMVASYVLAIDMTQIPIPARLEELTYMLPGSDIAGASAWTFLCQLAERISAMSEIKATVHFDPNLSVDISEMKLINDYFYLTGAEVDEESSTLTLTLNWKKQTQAINADNANPMCIVNGLKLIPKADAQWDSKNQLKIVNAGDISYKIYMRASALYSFSQKPENQQVFGLYSYINPNDSYDKGGYFQDTYKEFYDSYTLVNQLKDGWFNENGGFTYYVEGIKYTGVKLVDGVYYNFGENGFLATKTPYTGLFTEDGNTYYAKLGEKVSGWHNIGTDWYLFNWQECYGENGTYVTTIDGVEVTYLFENGKLLKGYWHNDGVGLQYFYGPYYYNQGWKTIDGKEYYFEKYYAATGVYPTRPAHAIKPTWYEFDEAGALIGDAPDGLHWFDGDLYYVVDNSSDHYGFYCIDGDYYYFNYDDTAVLNKSCWTSATNGVLPAGTYRFGADGKVIMAAGLQEENGILYYYADGRRQNNVGVVLVDGSYYYIDSGAIAITNQTFYVYKTNGLLTEGTYRFDAEGKMIVYTGLVEEDGARYYYQNGRRIANAGLVEYEGAYYYIGDKAMVQCDVTVWVGRTNGLLPVGTYSFGADGKMLAHNGIVDGYYYVDGVKTYAGLLQIDGDYYYAQWGGKLVKNQSFWISVTNDLLTAGTYRFDADGKIIMTTELVEENGELYYYENGRRSANAGLIRSGEDYYFITNGAKVIANETFYVYRTNGLLTAGTYRFDADGKMIIYTGMVNENDGWYYYLNGRRTANAGLIEFEGAYYFIGDMGKAASDKTLWVHKPNGYFPQASYTFDSDGKMIIYNGIVNGFYYVDGIKTSAGLIQVDGDYYYAQGGGMLVMNQSFWISSTHGMLTAGTYRFDADGKIIMTTDIVNENGTLYYYENGRRINCAGLIELNGDYYFVDSGSIVIADETFYVYKTNGLLAEGTYRFDAEGKMIVYTGMVSENGGLYYYRDGKRISNAGLIKFEDAYYHIGDLGKADCDTTVWVNNPNGYFPKASYTFGPDCKMIIYNGVVNGFYYVDGIKTNAGLIQVDGDYYYAQGGGKLVMNQSYWITATNGLLTAGTYRFDAEGKIIMTTDIVNENGTLYYYENGRRINCAGLVKLNGDYYFVDSGSIAVANQTFYVYKTNGLLTAGTYRFDAEGKMIIYTGMVNENDGWYYYLNGKRTANAGLIAFEGAYYYIGDMGKAAAGETVWVSRTNGYVAEGSYAFDADGKMISG